MKKRLQFMPSPVVLSLLSHPVYCLTGNPPHSNKKEEEKKASLKVPSTQKKDEKALLSLVTNSYFEIRALLPCSGVHLQDRLNWTQNLD